MTQRYLITGGAGFFGGLLKEHLLAQGAHCVCVDLHADPFTHSNLVSIEGDIADTELMNRVFNEHRFDAVFHIAALLAHEITDRTQLWRANVEGTRLLAELTAKHAIRQLVYTSSNCLYAKNFKRPVLEDDLPEPAEIYGRSKWEAEEILLSYADEFNSVILRCPTIISAGRLGLLAILFEFINEGRTVWVVGDGSSRYQFIYAPDLIDACVKASTHPHTRVFNIGSDNVDTLREVYEFVIRGAGSTSRVRSLPKAPTLAAMKLAYHLGISPLGPYHYRMIAESFVFDTTRIKTELGWHPTRTNGEMLLEAHQFYQQQLQNGFDPLASAHRRPAAMGVIRLLKWLS